MISKVSVGPKYIDFIIQDGTCERDTFYRTINVIYSLQKFVVTSAGHG